MHEPLFFVFFQNPKKNAGSLQASLEGLKVEKALYLGEAVRLVDPQDPEVCVCACCFGGEVLIGLCVCVFFLGGNVNWFVCGCLWWV